MSARPSLALDAIASQLVAALRTYDEDSERMVDTWPDLDLYRSVSDQVETIRHYSGALFEVRVQWVELLIAHGELIHFLWRVQYGNTKEADAKIDAVRTHHADCVAALQRRAERFLQQSAALRARSATPPT